MKSILRSFIYTTVFLALFGYASYTLYTQQLELNALKHEKNEYTTLCANEDMKHEKLVQIKEKLHSDDYIEEVAREKLGLVMPYEIIFVDASI